MKRSKGFTLSELMIGLFLLSVTAMILIGLFIAGIGHYRRLDTATTVGTLASQKMETIMTEDLAAAVSDSGNFPAPFADYSFQVAVTDQPGGIKDIQLSVTGPEDVTRELKSFRAPPSLDPGLAVFLKYDCWSCHSVAGLPANFAPIIAGPSFDSPAGVAWLATDRMNGDPGLASAVQTATGGTSAEDYLRFSIRNPGDYYITGFDPGSLGGNEMPEFSSDILPPGELELVVDWLSQFDSPP